MYRARVAYIEKGRERMYVSVNERESVCACGLKRYLTIEECVCEYMCEEE